MFAREVAVVLVLTRKRGEAVIIGDDIEIVVLGEEGENVKIGISAPKHVNIYRKEVYLSIQQANREASRLPSIEPGKLNDLLKRKN